MRSVSVWEWLLVGVLSVVAENAVGKCSIGAAFEVWTREERVRFGYFLHESFGSGESEPEMEPQGITT